MSHMKQKGVNKFHFYLTKMHLLITYSTISLKTLSKNNIFQKEYLNLPILTMPQAMIYLIIVFLRIFL